MTFGFSHGIIIIENMKGVIKMKRYLISVVEDNKGSIYANENTVTTLMFVTAANKHRAAYRAAREMEYRRIYTEYAGSIVWEIEKIDKNKYIASCLEMPTLHIYFLPVKENVEVITTTEME